MTDILIKRSNTNTAPQSLLAGELAYSFVSNTLFIGLPDNTVQNIGGASITGSLNVANNLHVGGDISLNGNLIIGNQNTDTVNVIADFSSNLIQTIQPKENKCLTLPLLLLP